MPDQAKAGDEVTVVLKLHGGVDCPSIEKHVDVVLVIDRSGSMWGAPLQAAKDAAKAFVDGLDLSPGGSQVALVSYADNATLDSGLTRSAATIRNAIDGLMEGGDTNITDGINTAQAELESARRDPDNSPVIILMSDGDHNVGAPPGPAAEAAKAKGTRIICIGLGAVNQTAMQNMASSAADYYYAPTQNELEQIYRQIAGSFAEVPATNITLVDQLSADVELVPGSFTGSPMPSVVGKTLTWKIPILGRGETKKFTYRVKISPTAQGRICCNDYTYATYTDSNGNPATLQIPPACVTIKNEVHDCYCKDHFGDDGSVPSNPNNEAWWESPDIWVRNQRDGVRVHQNPQGGQTNTVYVNVRNRGNTTLTNIDVNVYWAVGAAAIPWPGGWTLIGTANIPSLGAWQMITVDLPWQPATSGHYCFLARIHCADDPVRFEGLVPFDNNLCQKNVHVLDPEKPETWGDNTVKVPNPQGNSVNTDITVGSANYPPGGSVIVDIADETLFDRWQDNGGEVQGGQVIPGTTSIRLDISETGEVAGEISRIPLGPGEETTMDLRLEAPPGTNTRVRFQQSIGAEVVGGSSYRPPFAYELNFALIVKTAGYQTATPTPISPTN